MAAEPPVAGQARLEARVRGTVQGVGYRFHVRRHAAALGLVGWVANEPGGDVRCVAEGEVADLRALLGELERGPSGARVSAVDAAWRPATGGFASFEVRSGYHPGD